MSARTPESQTPASLRHLIALVRNLPDTPFTPELVTPPMNDQPILPSANLEDIIREEAKEEDEENKDEEQQHPLLSPAPSDDRPGVPEAPQLPSPPVGVSVIGRSSYQTGETRIIRPLRKALREHAGPIQASPTSRPEPSEIKDHATKTSRIDTSYHPSPPMTNIMRSTPSASSPSILHTRDTVATSTTLLEPPTRLVRAREYAHRPLITAGGLPSSTPVPMPPGIPDASLRGFQQSDHPQRHEPRIILLPPYDPHGRHSSDPRERAQYLSDLGVERMTYLKGLGLKFSAARSPGDGRPRIQSSEERSPSAGTVPPTVSPPRITRSPSRSDSTSNRRLSRSPVRSPQQAPSRSTPPKRTEVSPRRIATKRAAVDAFKRRVDQDGAEANTRRIEQAAHPRPLTPQGGVAMIRTDSFAMELERHRQDRDIFPSDLHVRRPGLTEQALASLRKSESEASPQGDSHHHRGHSVNRTTPEQLSWRMNRYCAHSPNPSSTPRTEQEIKAIPFRGSLKASFKASPDNENPVPERLDHAMRDDLPGLPQLRLLNSESDKPNDTLQPPPSPRLDPTPFAEAAEMLSSHLPSQQGHGYWPSAGIDLSTLPPSPLSLSTPLLSALSLLQHSALHTIEDTLRETVVALDQSTELSLPHKNNAPAKEQVTVDDSQPSIPPSDVNEKKKGKGAVDEEGHKKEGSEASSVDKGKGKGKEKENQGEGLVTLGSIERDSLRSRLAELELEVDVMESRGRELAEASHLVGERGEGVGTSSGQTELDSEQAALVRRGQRVQAEIHAIQAVLLANETALGGDESAIPPVSPSQAESSRSRSPEHHPAELDPAKIRLPSDEDERVYTDQDEPPPNYEVVTLPFNSPDSTAPGSQQIVLGVRFRDDRTPTYRPPSSSGSDAEALSSMSPRAYHRRYSSNVSSTRSSLYSDPFAFDALSLRSSIKSTISSSSTARSEDFQEHRRSAQDPPADAEGQPPSHALAEEKTLVAPLQPVKEDARKRFTLPMSGTYQAWRAWTQHTQLLIEGTMFRPAIRLTQASPEFGPSEPPENVARIPVDESPFNQTNIPPIVRRSTLAIGEEVEQAMVRALWPSQNITLPITDLLERNSTLLYTSDSLPKVHSAPPSPGARPALLRGSPFVQQALEARKNAWTTSDEAGGQTSGQRMSALLSVQTISTAPLLPATNDILRSPPPLRSSTDLDKTLLHVPRPTGSPRLPGPTDASRQRPVRSILKRPRRRLSSAVRHAEGLDEEIDRLCPMAPEVEERRDPMDPEYLLPSRPAPSPIGTPFEGPAPVPGITLLATSPHSTSNAQSFEVQPDVVGAHPNFTNIMIMGFALILSALRGLYRPTRPRPQDEESRGDGL